MAVRENQQQQPLLPQQAPAVATGRTPNQDVGRQHATQKHSLSVYAPGTNGSSLDNIFRVATIVQQIMTQLNDAVSE
jgi:hypothetical protein